MRRSPKALTPKARPPARAAGLALLLMVALCPATARAEPATENAWTVSGKILTALGAGTLSAVATPFVVGALPRMTGEADSFPTVFRQMDGIPVLSAFVGGGVALALGLSFWVRGARQQRKQAGLLEPASSGVRKAGIVLTASGLGLGGLAVLLAYMPGDCTLSDPPDCSYPERRVAVAAAITAVAATAVGIPLWVAGGHDGQSEHAPAISLVAAPHGLAFRGRF